MGLRFDLTLPLARYYSRHRGVLPTPFKAFHIGPVWRAERAQKGRYREFFQCDVDIVGSASLLADADPNESWLSDLKQRLADLRGELGKDGVTLPPAAPGKD